MSRPCKPFLLVVMLVCGCAPSRDAPKQNPSAIDSDADSPSDVGAFDFDESKGIISMDTRVPPPQRRTFAVGLGSVTLETLAVNHGKLTFRYTPEIEGGYTVYECTVSVSAKPVTIQINGDGTPGETSFGLANCKVIRTGNMLDDEPANEVPESRKTDLFLAHLELPELQASNPGVVGAVFDADPKNNKIERFVAYLASKGIQLQYRQGKECWCVVAPRFGDYEVQVENIGAFPDNATLLEMQLGCQAINLAHGLNPEAHLIMSLPGLNRVWDAPSGPISSQEFGKQIANISADPEYIAVENKLKQLFLEYEP